MTAPEESRKKKSPGCLQIIIGKLVQCFRWFRRRVTNDDQLLQQQQEMVMGMEQRLFLESPTMHVAPPLLGECSQQYVCPELAPVVPETWQSFMRQPPVKVEVESEDTKDEKNEKPFENKDKLSPKPGLNELFKREH